jgi:hypothetical protein
MARSGVKTMLVMAATVLGAGLSVPSPNPSSDDQLTSVSADSATDAWAVGYDAGTTTRTLILHWNGTAWSKG